MRGFILGAVALSAVAMLTAEANAGGCRSCNKQQVVVSSVQAYAAPIAVAPVQAYVAPVVAAPVYSYSVCPQPQAVVLQQQKQAVVLQQQQFAYGQQLNVAAVGVGKHRGRSSSVSVQRIRTRNR